MHFWYKKQPNQKKPNFNQQFTLEERVKKRKALEERYPKDNFSYLVIQGLLKFQAQPNPYIQYLLPQPRIAVENSMPITLLIEYLRKMLNLGKATSLFIEVDGKVKQIGKKIGELNKECVNEDGFLYITLKTENAFGNAIGVF